MFQKKVCLLLSALCISLLSACADSGVQVIQNVDPVTLEGLQIGLLVDQNMGNEVMIQGVTIPEGSTLSSAADVLLSTSINVVTTDFGGALGLAPCSIGGVGQPENDCFGDPNGNYWAFFYKGVDDTTWTVSPVGISNYEVNDGDLIGFVWTQFDPMTVPDDAWVIENFF